MQRGPILYRSRLQITLPTASTKRWLTPAQLANLKSRSKCKKCENFGHWAFYHHQDGTLKPKVLSTDQPASENASDSGTFNRSLTFSMHHITSGDHQVELLSDLVGPLLDNAAAYSGMGCEELELIQSLLCPDWDGTFDALHCEVSSTPYFGNMAQVFILVNPGQLLAHCWSQLESMKVHR